MLRTARRVAMLAAGLMVLAGGLNSASAQIEPSGQIEEFAFTLSNSSPQALVGVIYSTGVIGTSGGSVDFQSGAAREINLLDNAWTIIPTGNQPLNATVTDYRIVADDTVTGTAHVPAGASMSVTVGDTGQTFHLTNGKFSIPTGMGALGAKPPKRGNQVVKCRGDARSCRARIDLAGGAHNRRIVIRLTDTDLLLRSIKAPPRRAHAAYALTGGHFIDGGSAYVVTLNAARSSPPGSHVTLTFARSG